MARRKYFRIGPDGSIYRFGPRQPLADDGPCCNLLVYHWVLACLNEPRHSGKTAAEVAMVIRFPDEPVAVALDFLVDRGVIRRHRGKIFVPVLPDGRILELGIRLWHEAMFPYGMPD